MAILPEDFLTQAELDEWYKLRNRLAKIKSEEALLRGKVFRCMFPNPVEGTNHVALSEGFELKAVYPIARKVQEDLLSARVGELRAAGIKLDDVVVYKPEVAITEYRKLTDDQMKLFDSILEIKPGSPQLSIVQLKKPRKA